MKQTFEFNPARPGPDHTSGQQRNATAPAPRVGRLCCESRLRRRGFTFAEIMFAVMILGIGFIMVAAIFPVAIQQTQVTQEESVAATVAESAMQYMQWAGSDTDYPDINALLSPGAALDERIQPLMATLNGNTQFAWNKVCGNLIFKQNPRYAWVPLYRRNKKNNYAQVVFIIVQARLTDSFISTDVSPSGNNYPPLYPKKVTIASLNFGGNTGPDTVNFSAGTDPLGTGAFVVIGQTQSNGGTDVPTRIYRLGNQISNSTYELAPGYGMSSANENVANIEGWTIGRQMDANGAYQGPAMDIGCYTSFIKF